MENELTVYESHPLTAKDIQDQVALIQNVMKSVMKDGEHYGKIPGCGDKPALLKPGAEKLNLTFRMAPDFQIETVDLGRGHREYRVKCSLQSITTGRFLGMGVGSASTMEGKWRFRIGPVEWTGKAVPKEYWDLRKSDPMKSQELLGGKGFQPKKNDSGIWEIARQGEKVEHDNPADYYNTCLKMAKKRAHVDAVLTVTAASDIFTQDIEEMVENNVEPEKSKEQSKEKPKPDFDFLKQAGEAKKQLKALTGSDEEYYKCLNAWQYNHANEVTEQDRKGVYDDLRETYKNVKASIEKGKANGKDKA